MTIKRRYGFTIFLLLIGLCMAGCIAAVPNGVTAQDRLAQESQGVGDDDRDEENDDDNTVEDQDEAGEGEGYSVDVTAADFVNVVDNPYFPLIPGTRWVYESKLADGSTERIELEILHETHQVNGVAATILHDSAFTDGELIEETFDWYAQDQEGNVWYLGEDVDNYENGVLVDHEGSWQWGVEGALPGIYMWADPASHLNEAYYQEYYPGVAEDIGQVLSASESITVPVGSFAAVVQTYDFSALDPELQEHKFYAPGVGVIKEVGLESGEEAVLVEFTPAETLATSATTAEMLPQPTTGLPTEVAPASARVDIFKPTFTNPTSITNPLLPIAEVDQLIQLGQKDGKPHRALLQHQN